MTHPADPRPLASPSASRLTPERWRQGEVVLCLATVLTCEAAVDGATEGYGTYPAGMSHLDRLRTLNLTRLVHPPGQAAPDTWGSLSRQDAVLQGMLGAALQPENLSKLPELVKALRQAVTTTKMALA